MRMPFHFAEESCIIMKNKTGFTPVKGDGSMKKLLLLALCLCLAMGSALASEAAVEGVGLQGGKAEIPELTGMTRYEIPDNEAMTFLRRMGIGWNLGNTFDATWNNPGGNDMELEKYWNGYYTTENMIDQVHLAGYDTIRIPVSWHNHLADDDFTINEAWLNRVQEVVDWAYERGMTVILNTHHDEGYDTFYLDNAHMAVSEKYVSSIWRQLAERFAGYDDHLIFESLNEPRLTQDKAHEWWFDGTNAGCREAMTCLIRLNQVFVDTVRAAGGCNTDRYLMVPSYDASPDCAVNNLFVLPTDTADNRIIVSVHAYTPYDFALNGSGTDAFSINNRRSVNDINSFMNALYRKYISAGIPVVIGEFGARAKNNNLQARVDFAAYYTASAISRGMPCLWWDNNAFSGDGENFGLLRRMKENWLCPDIVVAMVRYSTIEKIFGD